MSSGLELHDSRISRFELLEDVAILHFSHAYIHKSKGKPGRGPGTGWSQEVKLFLFEPNISGLVPPLPNSISEGYLEVGGIKHELIPLPFKRKVSAKLWLQFVDDTQLIVTCKQPVIELLGKAVYLEDF